jgi:hypothetical protein
MIIGIVTLGATLHDLDFLHSAVNCGVQNAVALHLD